MDKLQMLAKVIFPVKCPLFQGSLLARRVIMALDVRVIWVGLPTEYTGDAIGLRVQSARPIRSTYPSFQRQMKGLLVSLPIMLGAEGLRAESTLEGL